MKTLKLTIIGIMILLTSIVKAQVSVNINIGSPPPWGPIGYTDVHYYYLPDVEAYYDIQSSMFIYYVGGSWIHRSFLPSYYRNYDLYSGYKVVMTDYRGNTPYIYFKDHKKKYAKGYKGKEQKTISPKPGKGKTDKQGGTNKQGSSNKQGATNKQSGTNKSASSNKPGNQNSSKKDGQGNKNNKSSGSDKNKQSKNGQGGGKKK